jgi:subtilisin-like proprotein convertase family protein
MSHTVSPNSGTTYTANFTTQYYLTMNAGAGGTVSPSSGWRNSGTSVSISATPNSGYSFSGWTGSGSGSYSGNNNPASITMNGPISETASFTQNPVSVTVQTSPSGRSFTVDGTTYTTSQTFSWTPGSSHTIGATSPQSGGTGVQYVWSSWSDGGAISHTVAPTSGTTYTAYFATQYYLTMVAGAGGSVNPSSGWYNSGAVVSISATPNSGYSFSGWTGSGSGSYSGNNNPASITMSGPITETASFTQNPISVTVQTSPSGRSFTVDGATYTTAQTFNWVPGSSHTIGTTSPQSGGTGVQYVWSSWSDGGAISHTVAPTAGATYTANFATEFQLTAVSSPSDSGTFTFNPLGSWYAPNQAVQITAIPANGYTFVSWSGDASGSANPLTVVMNAPHNLVGNFTATNTNEVVIENLAPITIPAIGDRGPALPYPSTIAVSGIAGQVNQVRLSLNRLSHTYPDDLDVLLVSPSDRSVLVMSDSGGGADITDVSLTLDDNAATALPDAGPLTTGVFRPGNYPDTNPTNDLLPSPAPSNVPYLTTLSVFAGDDPNGTWSLYVFDDGAGDIGQIAGGWTLFLTITNPPTISRTLTVASINPANGVGIMVNPTDTNGLSDGSTLFARVYSNSAAVTLTAPLIAACNAFQKWQRDGVDWTNNPTAVVVMDADHTMTAVYAPTGAVAYENIAVISVPASGDRGPATPYPSTLAVYGIAGQVSQVRLRLDRLSHTFPDDLDVLLVSPSGRSALVMSDAGGGISVTDVSLTLDDNAATALPDAGPLVTGVVRPGNYPDTNPTNDLLPSPAPSNVPYPTSLNVFVGDDPNGTWSLYVFDDGAGDIGQIAGGWTLFITTLAGCPPTVAITNPPAGATFTAPATITIEATASDSDGSVTKVEFYANGTRLGEDTTTPYSLALINFPNGTHSLYAVATDDIGNHGTSGAVNITVIGPIQALVNAAVPGATIYIPAGNYIDHDVVIDKNLTLCGAGREFTVINASQLGRVFYIMSNTVVTLCDLWIKDGYIPVGWLGVGGRDGGAILNEGKLTMRDCRVSDCCVEHGFAGGISSGGDLILERCEVVGNCALLVGAISCFGRSVFND